MSTYSDASLIFYPSGYKESKLYSLKPTDGIGDLTFTRASTATRVNSDGLIETSPVNLLTYSNTFSNAAWVKDRCTVTYGQSGYDGTNDAWLMQSTATALSSRCYQVFSGNNNFNRSVYAKKGTSDYVAIYTTSSAYAYFNLSNGTIGTQSLNVNASILSVGNGWYRCSVTMSSIYQNHYIFIANSDNSTTTNSGDNIYIQDAQLNLGSTAKPYFPTTDRSNVPRIDYTGGGCGKLLLEPQRTNLVTYSEQLDNAAWTKSAVTVTANATTSPDGYTNADKLIATAVSGFHNTSQSIGSKIALTPYTFSFFAKADEISFCLPNISSTFSGTQLAALINLSDGTISGVSAGLSVSTEDYGNGWYRIKLTATSQNNTSAFLVTINATNASGASNFTGDGTSGILLYGAQVEAGSYSTSYIPTSGTAVTRLADSASKTGISSVIGQTEGVFYVEIAALVNDNSGRYISISNSTNNNRIIIGFDTASNRIYVYVTSSGSSQVSMFYEVSDILNFNKVAFKYKVNDFSLWVNGVERATDIIGILPTSLTSITFNSGGGGNIFYGKMQNLMLFPSALSDTELATLTTI